ncbi:type II toxin-antitoxin system RelB family antitoxin [Pseudoduganella aquatica]|uniref:CopG family transcriptional regulator n=1 Tax=Pseudoduganella aquatica TaxID=2660641 RepID=A0A7X4KMA3_9BURK|nr:CopG family transcriptional regulator [Pseudoduganella aquatica]MYN09054.1 CopG family transcriptional regulator [Pseudoduganella aquatica]
MATTIQLDPKNDLILEDLAARIGQTKEELLRQLVDIAVEELEHFYSAVEIAEKVRTGEEQVFSSAEVKAHLGLAD